MLQVDCPEATSQLWYNLITDAIKNRVNNVVSRQYLEKSKVAYS